MIAKGASEFTLKSIESKGGIKVACIGGSAEIDVTNKSKRGVMKGTQKVTFEAKVAIEGGYIVTANITSETKGKITGINPKTTKEETSEIAIFSRDKIEFIE